MKLNVRIVELPLRHVFRIAHGARTVQRNVIVELGEGELRGYGEVAPVPYYGITAESIVATLEGARAAIEGAELGEPAEFWEQMRRPLGDNKFALCAMDEAAHDLWGKRLGQPVHRLWGLDTATGPASNYTIGIDTIKNMAAKMKEFDGWPIYKIKLGTAEDIRIVTELRKHTAARFRVDANTAWSVEQAIENSRQLAGLGVEFIEQPLAKEDWEGAARVYAKAALPIIADESCVTEEDVAKCEGRYHGVNIKLTKAGGLTPARRMIADARRRGLKVMVGCMTESTVGISSIAQLLGLLDYVDMDGACLLAKDIASGVRVEKGRAIFPQENGCGVRLL